MLLIFLIMILPLEAHLNVPSILFRVIPQKIELGKIGDNGVDITLLGDGFLNCDAMWVWMSCIDPGYCGMRCGIGGAAFPPPEWLLWVSPDGKSGRTTLPKEYFFPPYYTCQDTKVKVAFYGHGAAHSFSEMSNSLEIEILPEGSTTSRFPLFLPMVIR